VIGPARRLLPVAVLLVGFFAAAVVTVLAGRWRRADRVQRDRETAQIVSAAIDARLDARFRAVRGPALAFDLSSLDARETSGVLPSREWKERVREQAWYPGETVISGIGQGFWVASPLQLAQATATLASGGHPHRLHLLRNTQAGFDAPLVPVVEAESMSEAVGKAFDLARPDGVVLLAPACASFDMFRDYADRGRAFKEAVQLLLGRRVMEP
jgi:type II secretory pathway pseudopilin PulG